MSKRKDAAAIVALTGALASPAALQGQQTTTPAADQGNAIIAHAAPDPKAVTLPDDPGSLIVQAPTQAKPNFAERVMDGGKKELATVDHYTRLRPEIDPYGADLAFRLKGDRNPNHFYAPGGSEDMVGITKREGDGAEINAGWRSDLVGRWNFGNGPLDSHRQSKEYGSRTQAFVGGQKGPFSGELNGTALAEEMRFKLHLSPYEVDQQLAAMGLPSQYAQQYASEITSNLPRTTQPLFMGDVSGYGEFAPSKLSLTDAKHNVDLGLAVGVGGDKYYGSVVKGEDLQVCATPVKLGQGSAAASMCYDWSKESGYANPNGIGNGYHARVNIDPARMGKAWEGAREVGEKTRRLLSHRSADTTTEQRK